ncbi:Bpu10I family restriction endonuclease [Pseudoxanthomonas winnipegensis]|nr:Bpu10I family restriction endonuclease [Pseudoxanthomonas winnipegensis]
MKRSEMPITDETELQEVPAIAESAFVTSRTPHKDKLVAAIQNKKAEDDVAVLEAALAAYEEWITALSSLKTKGRQRVDEMTSLLNAYKNHLEVDLILEKGSPFLTRQKGQMKLDNSVLEEFFMHLVRDEIIDGLPKSDYLVGPQRAFMSLAFMPGSFESLFKKPDVVIKSKDQDFIIGANINYSFSAGVEDVSGENVQSGTFAIAAMAAECKVNLDKTMFQEAAGTAARLKQGCPFAKYYLIVEYLDMTPEDVRLTAIDNVFLLRKAKRLPYEKRTDLASVRAQRDLNPISSDVIWKIVEEIQSTVKAVWYDPEEVFARGSFA